MQRFLTVRYATLRILIALSAAFASMTMIFSAPFAAWADAPTCKLQQIAFCDMFTTAYHGGGRTGELDPTRWSVARLSNVSNWTQGQLNEFFATSLPVCDHNVGNAVPNGDVRVCTPDPGELPYFDELFNDDGNFVFSTFRIRQPFDFANRTGTIVFDVDAKTAGSHTWWLELWITDQPVPAPNGSTVGVHPSPRNGVDIQFSGCGQPPSHGGNDTIGGVELIRVVRNYNVSEITASATGANCYKTADGKRNHIEVRVNQQRVETWASDSDGSNFRMVASNDNLNLPFTRGYVNFEHVHYNASKEAEPAQQHYEWGASGFDGPVLPTPRGYDVPDALAPGRASGSINLGYNLNNGSMQSNGKAIPAFVLHAVDLGSATGAEINLNIQSYSAGSLLQYRLNGGAWRTVAYPFPDTSNSWRAMMIPVALGDLLSGDNTLEFAAHDILQFTNVDLTVETDSTALPAAPALPAPTDTPPPPATMLPAPAVTEPSVAPPDMSPPDSQRADSSTDTNPPSPPDMPSPSDDNPSG